MFVIKLGHGDVVVIVQLLVPEFFENEVTLLHVGVAVNQLFELLVEHLKSMYMDEVLNVLQARTKTL